MKTDVKIQNDDREIVMVPPEGGWGYMICLALVLIGEMKTAVKRHNDDREIVMGPPEGGWGYMMCLALMLMFMGSATLIVCFGLLFNDFIKDVGGGTKEVTVMQTVSSILSSIAAITMSAMLNHCSLRQVGLAGAGIVVFGSLMMIWVSNIYELMIYFIMIYVGLDIQIMVTYTAFNSYFNKKRVFLLSQCKAIVGLIFMFAPLVAQWVLRQYGFRGTLMLFAAFNSHTVLAMLILQPVKKHLVPKKLSIQYSALPTAEPETVRHNSASFPDEDVHTNLGDAEETPREILNNDDFRRMSIPIVTINQDDRRASMPHTRNANRKRLESMDQEMKKSIQNHLEAVSALSLGGISSTTGAVELPPIVDKKGRWHTIVRFVDWSLLKDKTYLNIAIGIAFVFFTEMTFLLIFPLMLFDKGYSVDHVAICLSAHAGGDMAARFLLAAVSKFFPLKPRYVFFCGATTGFIMRTALNLIQDWRIMATLAALTGVGKCLTHLTLPLILADHVKIEKYPTAYGLYMIVAGCVNILFGPIIGIIRDVTSSYRISTLILNSLFLVCIIPWMIEFIINRRRTNRNDHIIGNSSVNN